MTLTELRYIVTLAQESHFGRAAERCHVSQPTLSVGVKKLEDELGVLIFERTKSAVRLTPVGEGIVTQAQKVLEQAQSIRELAQAGKNQLAAPLKVGAIYTVGPYLFPHLIPQLHRVAPQMPLYIEENFTHVLREKLRNGELDAVIIALPFNEADVLTLPLYDEPFCALMPADHPWTVCLLGAARGIVGEPAKVAASQWPCDAFIHQRFGMPTLLFGPKGAGSHNANEYVEVRSVLRTAETYLAAALEWCA